MSETQAERDRETPTETEDTQRRRQTQRHTERQRKRRRKRQTKTHTHRDGDTKRVRERRESGPWAPQPHHQLPSAPAPPVDSTPFGLLFSAPHPEEAERAGWTPEQAGSHSLITAAPGRAGRAGPACEVALPARTQGAGPPDSHPRLLIHTPPSHAGSCDLQRVLNQTLFGPRPGWRAKCRLQTTRKKEITDGDGDRNNSSFLKPKMPMGSMQSGEPQTGAWGEAPVSTGRLAGRGCGGLVVSPSSPSPPARGQTPGRRKGGKPREGLAGAWAGQGQRAGGTELTACTAQLHPCGSGRCADRCPSHRWARRSGPHL